MSDVYLGAYLEVKPKPVDVTVNRWVCDNGCTNRTIESASIKFCPTCGTKIKKISEVVKLNKYYDNSIDDEYLDVLTCPAYICGRINEDDGSYILIANNTSLTYSIFIDKLNKPNEVMRSDIPKLSIEEFNMVYSNIINYLNESDFVESMEIKFGALTYDY